MTLCFLLKLNIANPCAGFFLCQLPLCRPKPQLGQGYSARAHTNTRAHTHTHTKDIVTTAQGTD